MRTLGCLWQSFVSDGCFQSGGNSPSLLVSVISEEVEFNISAASRGALPDELNAAIAEIGIVHPLIYQARTQI